MACVGQVEIDPFCRRVLHKHWPNVPRWEDVRQFQGDMIGGKVDLVAGGFPCQDISVAGRGAGLEGERSGLWRERHRIIGELRPTWVLAENVPALRTKGIDRVTDDLAGLGYTSWPVVVGAWAVGAPHKRDRVWVVATNRSGDGAQGQPEEPLCGEPAFSWVQNVRGPADLRGRSDLPPPLIWRTGHGIPNWMDRVKSCGNAVVPQVVEVIGRVILKLHKETQ